MSRQTADFKHPLPQPLTWRDSIFAVAALMFGALVAIVVYLAVSPYAKARDAGQWEDSNPLIHYWFKSLMQPDNPGISCWATLHLTVCEG